MSSLFQFVTKDGVPVEELERGVRAEHMPISVRVRSPTNSITRTITTSSTGCLIKRICRPPYLPQIPSKEELTPDQLKN